VSYDLHLFRLPSGKDPSAAYREYAEKQERVAADISGCLKRSAAEPARGKMQALADRLRFMCPGFEQFHPPNPLSWIELNHEDLQVQVEIHEDAVTITMPYFRQQSAVMMELVGRCIEKLKMEENLVAYDPQLDRVVGANDVKAMLDQYHAVDSSLPELERVSNTEVNPRRPWWRIW
jgi:hypothetical protein